MPTCLAMRSEDGIMLIQTGRTKQGNLTAAVDRAGWRSPKNRRVPAAKARGKVGVRRAVERVWKAD